MKGNETKILFQPICKNIFIINKATINKVVLDLACGYGRNSLFLSNKGYKVIGIDNNLRKTFFGEEASTAWNLKELQRKVPNYDHFPVDIRDSSICLQLQLQGNLLPYVQGT